MPSPVRNPIAFVMALAIAMAACAPAAAPANAQANEPVVAEEAPPPPGQAAAAPKEERKGEGEAPPPVASKPYDLVVSFRSQGQGIDHDARSRLDAIFDATPSLGRAHGRWGREGEVDEGADVERPGPCDRAAPAARVRAARQWAQDVACQERALRTWAAGSSGGVRPWAKKRDWMESATEPSSRECVLTSRAGARRGPS